MHTKQQRTFSEAETAAWRAAKHQRLANLGQQLKPQVAAVQDSDALSAIWRPRPSFTTTARGSRPGRAGRQVRYGKEDTQSRNVTHWNGTSERHVPYRLLRSRRRRPLIVRIFLSEEG